MCSGSDLEKNLNIVQINEQELVYHITQHIIDKTLENTWAVSQAKRKDLVFIVACGRVEGRLPLIPLLDAHQVIGITQVQLGEDGSPL